MVKKIPVTEEEVKEQQVLLSKVRGQAHKVKAQFKGELAEGAGKGKEPEPWCGCHNRNPCPKRKEVFGE